MSIQQRHDAVGADGDRLAEVHHQEQVGISGVQHGLQAFDGHGVSSDDAIVRLGGVVDDDRLRHCFLKFAQSDEFILRRFVAANGLVSLVLDCVPGKLPTATAAAVPINDGQKFLPGI